MSQFHIVLADEDDSYISTLEFRFLEQYHESAQIEVISNPVYFQQFFQTPRRLNLLIVNESLYTPELRRHQIDTIIVLSEQEGGHLLSEEGEKVLYKYTSMKELLRTISHLVDIPELKSDDGTKVICVYSPIGGIGSTTTALALTAALNQGHKRALYINTETVQSFTGFFETPPDMINAEFRTMLLAKNPHIAQLLPAACQRMQDVEFLQPFEHSLTTYGISLTHFAHLTDALREEGSYQYVILDCSTEFTQEKSLLMSRCDHVIILTGQSGYECRRLFELLRNINLLDSNRFLFACNRYDERQENLVSQMLPSQISIAEYVPEFTAELRYRPERLGRHEAITRLAYRIS